MQRFTPEGELLSRTGPEVLRVDNDYVSTTWTREPSGLIHTTSQTGLGPSYATYDLSGRVVWRKDAAGTETVYTWRPEPHEATVTTIRNGPGGARARLTTASIESLNPVGQPNSVTEFGSGLTRSTSFARDGDGQVTDTVDPEQLRTRFERNLAGWTEVAKRQRVRGAVAALDCATNAECTRQTFDRRGLVTHVDDANGFGTEVSYNGFGDVQRREVPDVAPVVFTYDELGRPATRATAAGTVRHLYDARGDNWEDDVVTGTSAQALIQRGFDALGRLQSATNFNLGLTSIPAADRPVVTSFGYDAAGRPSGELRRVGVGPVHGLAAEYSLSSGGTWQRDVHLPAKAWRDEFDAAGRLSSKRRWAGASLAPEGMKFGWLGELPSSREQAQGRPSPFRQVVARDSFGAPSQWTYSAIDLTRGGSPQDATEGAAYCNGAWDGAACGSPLLRIDAIRDVVGRVGSLQWKFANPASTSAAARAAPWRGYTYSALSRLEKSLEHAGVGAAVSTAGLVPHLLTGSDVEAAGVQAEAWGYERAPLVGSLTGIRNAQSGAYRWKVTQQRVGYQLTGVEVDAASRTVNHDKDGRTVQDGNRTFVFDLLDQLVEVQVAGVAVEKYAYDGVGRLSAQFNGATPTSSFLYDGPNIVASYSATGQQQWEAVWGPGQDSLVEWVDTAGGTGAHLPLADHRNSIVATWDVTPGALSKTAEYNAEGRVTLSKTDGTVDCKEDGTGAVCGHPAGMPFGFGSAWRSSATGLINMRARWYSTQLGEFISPDPVGYVDSFNLYAYAAFDPVNNWDPLGLTIVLGANDRLNRAFEAIKSTPSGAATIARLEASAVTFDVDVWRLPADGEKFVLGQTGRGEGVPKDFEDPTGGIEGKGYVMVVIDPTNIDDFNKKQPKGLPKASDVATLAHELNHATDYEKGFPPKKKSEDRANEHETKVLSELGKGNAANKPLPAPRPPREGDRPDVNPIPSRRLEVSPGTLSRLRPPPPPKPRKPGPTTAGAGNTCKKSMACGGGR